MKGTDDKRDREGGRRGSEPAAGLAADEDNFIITFNFLIKIFGWESCNLTMVGNLTNWKHKCVSK